MECFWGKKPINSDLPLTESLNAICNPAYRKNITKAMLQEVTNGIAFRKFLK